MRILRFVPPIIAFAMLPSSSTVLAEEGVAGKFALKVAWAKSSQSAAKPAGVWLGVVNMTGQDILIADAGKNSTELVECPDGTSYGSTHFVTTDDFPEGISPYDVHLVRNGGEHYFFHKFASRCAGKVSVEFSVRVMWIPGRDVARRDSIRVDWARKTIRVHVDP